MTFYVMATRRTNSGKMFKNGKWHHHMTIKTSKQADNMTVMCSNGFYMYEVRTGNHHVIEHFQPEDAFEACRRMKERLQNG